MLDLRAIDDRENTCAERVFPRYEPPGPSFKLIINLGWKDMKDGTHYRQLDPHFSDQNAV